jgi:hypothetical protein
MSTESKVVQHTPGITGPLDFFPPHKGSSEGVAFVIYPATTSEPLAEVLQRDGDEEIARRLVRCVNEHDGLVSALEDLIDAAEWLTGGGDEDGISDDVCRALEKARAAITLATGEGAAMKEQKT